MPVGLLQTHPEQVGQVDPDPALPPLPGGAAEIARFLLSEVPPWLQITGAVAGGTGAVVLAVLAWRHRRAIVLWTAALPAVVKATAVAVVVAGGTVAAVAGYRVYDFVEHDNRFCTGCHVMAEAYVSFDESAHRELGCKECHAQPRTESARQLYLWVLDRPQEVGPHSPVPDARCRSCHVEGDPEQWAQIEASLGHRVHLESDDPDLVEAMCVTCHGVSVHEFQPADATCGECHEAEATVRLGRMADEAELHCVACHDFLGDEPADLPGIAEGIALLPERAQCAACHEMAGLLAEAELDVDPHGAVCGACHNPHTQETPADAVETCLDCHERADTITVFHTGTHAPVLPNCTACHSAHRWQVDGTDCLACHETVMDEPLAAAGWDEKPGPRAPPMGDGRTLRQAPSLPWGLLAGHDGAGGPHAERPDDSGRWNEPGSGSVPRVEGGGPPAAPFPGDTVPPRPFLHRQHEALSCSECHGTAEEHGVVTVRTARECAQCHHDPARGYDCADCHAAEDLRVPREVASPMLLTVWDEPRIRELPFDHGEHETLECQECHTGPVLLAVERECAACHEDHHRPRAECARCHVEAEPNVHGLEVHLTCTSSGCHAGEAGVRPALTRTLCLACHQDQWDHEPGLDCHACHRVPEAVPARPAPRTAPVGDGGDGP